MYPKQSQDDAWLISSELDTSVCNEEMKVKNTYYLNKFEIPRDDITTANFINIDPWLDEIKLKASLNTSTCFHNSWVTYDSSITSDSTTRAYITICNDARLYWVDDNWSISPTEKKRNKLKEQLAPTILNHRGDRARSENKGDLFNRATPEELVALQLLRKMVSQEVFKKYLKHHFVVIQGESGLWYQIRRDNSHIKVWKNGSLLCELCVYVSGVPPTDSVVSKMIIIECNEVDIWNRANVYWKNAPKDLKYFDFEEILEHHTRLVA